MEHPALIPSSDVHPTEAAVSRPYAPSPTDRFLNFIQRLPWPYWVTYLALFVVQSLLAHVVAWETHWLPLFQVNVILLVFPVWQWMTFAFITHLNSVAKRAVDSFNSLLQVDAEELERLKAQFTTMPVRGVLLSGIFWVVVYLFFTFVTYNAFYVSYQVNTFLFAVIFLEGLASYATGSAIYYHSLRQLALVSQTVQRVRHFNLFHLEPVYAFSRLTAQTGIAWMILLSLTLLFYPMQLANGPVLAVLILQVLLAIAAFVLPLWFVHTRLVAEKRHLLAEHSHRTQAALERLHQSVDENQLADAQQLNNMITALNSELAILGRIPTWPWRSETLTGFLSAIGTPIALFLIQLALKRWLGM